MKMYSINHTNNQWQVIKKNHKRARKEEETSSTLDNGRNTSYNQDRLQVAYAPRRLRSVADSVLLLPQTLQRLRISGPYRRDDDATRLLGDYA